MNYTLGENGHEVEEIYNIPLTDKWVDKSSQQVFGAAFERLQSKASKDLGWKSIYIQHYFIIDHSKLIGVSLILKITLGIYHVRSIER